jgi:hypothetical protein
VADAPASAETELALQLGLETTVSDPVLVRRGARLGGIVRPERWWGVGVWVGAYPAMGRLDWTVTTRELVDQDRDVAPNLSRVLARGDVGAELTPLRASTERATTALRLLVALGASYTVDDLSFVAAQDEPAQAGEWSPTMSWGGAVETWHGPLGLQVRCSQTMHHELTWDGRPQWKTPLWVGLDVSLRLSRDSE